MTAQTQPPAAQPVLPFPTVVVPTEPRRTRTNLYRTVVEYGMEFQVRAERGHGDLVASREADRHADASVEQMDRLACRIAQIAFVNDRDPIWREVLDLAVRQRAHAQQYREHDSTEDALVVRAGGVLAWVRKVGHALCRTFSRELNRRGDR